jgi:ComF family protein
MLSGPSIFRAAIGAARDVEALLLPLACLSCGRQVTASARGPLCEACRNGLREIAPPRCRRCGQTLDAWEPERDAACCGFCRAWPDTLAWAASAVWFDDGPARELVHALKYGGWHAAAAPMAAEMARRLRQALRPGDTLVPVPLGALRQRERGHNQAAVLAAALGRLLGLEVSAAALVRTRETRTQTALHPAARRANVAGAFRAAGRAGGRAVLVDDVLTTGATLGAAAEALAAAGWADVGAVTFARAGKPGDAVGRQVT